MSNFQQNLSAQPRDVLSVTTLNRLAKSLLEGHFPNVLVEGEISNLALPASGHWYFTLKDEGAQIRCAMFRNRNMGAGMRPRDGMQVQVRGRLSLYEGRGDYQLIAESVEEAGDGALRRRFELLKQKLAAEGLFASERKRPMPAHVRHIGVITSPTGAVIRDILSVLRRRFPSIAVTILPVPVQGGEAPAAIVKAIATANRRAAELGLDVLIVGRGGGSLEDLQPFNEESVARAIHGSQLPVVSAVGHETDITIADFVADLRAPTPSAAAELLSPDQGELLQTLQGFTLLLRRLIGERLQHHTRALLWLTRQLKHPGRRLQEHAQTLDMLEGRLLRATWQTLANAGHQLGRMQQTLALHSPLTVIRQHSLRRAALQHRLQRAMQQGLQRQQAVLAALARSLDSISPLQTLRRGYSITWNERHELVRDAQQLVPGQTLHTRLGHGAVRSTVVAILPDDPLPDA